MPNLLSGTFLRLYGGDAQGTVAALEVPISQVTVPTPLDTALTALLAATYGTGKPSNAIAIGYDIEVLHDNGSTGSARAGDARNIWRTSFNVDNVRPDIVGVPGRDDQSPSLLLPGTLDQINTAATPWTAWVTALHAATLNAPLGSAGAGAFVGGVASVYRRVRPRERIRVISNPIILGGTQFHLWAMDTAGRKKYVKFYGTPFVLATQLVTDINALGAATFGSIPGAGPIKPSLLEYEGFSVIVRVDNGYTGGGAGDMRNIWQMTFRTATGREVRFRIPGRNTDTAGLYLAGTRNLANISGSIWQAWLTALTATGIGGPIDPITTASATLVGGRATVRPYVAPRQ